MNIHTIILLRDIVTVDVANWYVKRPGAFEISDARRQMYVYSHPISW